jgi:hypothetical protein
MLSIYILIMIDTLLLRPSLHFNTLHRTTLHILRRNCLLKLNIELKREGRTEMTGRRGRKRKHILDDLKET